MKTQYSAVYITKEVRKEGISIRTNLVENVVLDRPTDTPTYRVAMSRLKPIPAFKSDQSSCLS